MINRDIAIIDYGAGNLFSIAAACRRLGYDVTVTSDPEIIEQSSRVIFPGVGNAAAAREALDRSQLADVIPQLTMPVLGICLGMQMMTRRSDEGDTACLSIFTCDVKEFDRSDKRMQQLKVPHMGWNRAYELQGPLFKGISEGAWLYFVHSYYAPLCDQSAAVTSYGIPFSAALWRDNFFGCQFHPEKSGVTGIQILKNFLEL